MVLCNLWPPSSQHWQNYYWNTLELRALTVWWFRDPLSRGNLAYCHNSYSHTSRYLTSYLQHLLVWHYNNSRTVCKLWSAHSTCYELIMYNTYVCVNIYIYMWIYMYFSISLHVYIYKSIDLSYPSVSISLYIYTYIYIHTSVCMYIYINIYILYIHR